MFRTMLYAWVGCLLLGTAISSAQADEKLKASVIHWWTSGSEAAAVKVFADHFNQAGGAWEDNAVAGGEQARAMAINRIVGGQPPTAAQFNTGKQFSDLVTQGVLRDVEDIAEEEKWRSFMPPSFVKASTHDGKFYAVPVDVHGQNWIFYSKKVFQESGIDKPPMNFDELFADMDKIKAAGYLPLVVGENTWQQRLLFSTVVLGKGGKDFYMKFYTDQDAATVDSPKFMEVLKTFARLRGYVEPGTSGRHWNDATAKVITDRAGMQIMGDWAKGEFFNADEQAGKDFGCVLMPDSQTLMVGGDVFIFPETGDEEQRKAQDLLAKTMLDPQTQVEFSQHKGSLPIRTDVDMAGLDSCTEAGLSKLKSGDTAPVPDFLITPDLYGRIGDIVAEFWSDRSMTPEQVRDEFREVMSSGI